VTTNVVLFLGAGFSREFGLPVMREFPDIARVHPRVGEPARRVLSELLIEAREANSFLKSEARNIEDVLSFAEMGNRLGLNDGTRPAVIRRMLQAVYSSPPTGDLDKKARRLATMLGYSTDKELQVIAEFQSKGLSVVTTNYDLNPEFLLRKMHLFVRLGAADADTFNVPPNMAYSQHLDEAVPIFKLHGAVNWFEASEANTIIVDVTPGAHHQPNAPRWPHICSVRTDGEASDPVIVPPSFLKPELSNALSSVWAGAARVLEDADCLIFIGYSFPPTDTEMSYFLARSLTGNTRLSKIFIVDPNAKAIAERLGASNARYGNHFTDLLTPISKPWSEAGLLNVPFTWSREQRASVALR
jgi:hypothetical protein